ncbi:MAG: alkaline phosphatase family protein, partial [Bacteroidales bacterium]|nr:alkaline phosphatase family protein [Bacteroidales bacterium]
PGFGAMQKAELQGYNPSFCIAPKPGFADSVYQSLKKVEGMKIWFSDEVPERLHYGSNPRCLDFVIVADSGWSVIEKQGKKVGKGAHGYDNTNQNMHAIFYAKGPAFREKYTAPVFNNIDIYPLICEILELKPARVDGTLKNVEGMLK